MRRLYVLGIVSLILLTGCLGGEAPTTETTTTQPVSGIDGKAIYDANCRICHGVDGKGVEGTGASDLTSSAVKALGKDQMIAQVTAGGEQMPSFSKALTSEEIEAVVEYIGTLE